MKYLTLVNFGSSYEKGVWVDTIITSEWETQRSIQDLMDLVDGDAAKQAVFNQMPAKELADAKKMCSALHGMQMRARFNPHRLNGPHILYHDTPLEDEALIAWAKCNVYKKG